MPNEVLLLVILLAATSISSSFDKLFYTYTQPEQTALTSLVPNYRRLNNRQGNSSCSALPICTKCILFLLQQTLILPPTVSYGRSSRSTTTTAMTAITIYSVVLCLIATNRLICMHTVPLHCTCCHCGNNFSRLQICNFPPSRFPSVGVVTS